MADWYPEQLGDRPAWHANFAAQAAATGTTHNLTAAEVTQIANDSALVEDAVNFGADVFAWGQAITAWRSSVLEGDPLAAFPPVPTSPVVPTFEGGEKPGIEERTRGFAARIRGAGNYTTEIGENYGIVAPAPAPPGTPTVLAQALTQSQVRLSIGKAGYSVLAVDSRRGGGGWEQIAVAQTAEYIDGRAPLVAGQPELREYRVQGMQNNQRVGALSGVSSAVTVP